MLLSSLHAKSKEYLSYFFITAYMLVAHTLPAPQQSHLFHTVYGDSFDVAYLRDASSSSSIDLAVKFVGHETTERKNGGVAYIDADRDNAEDK